ncbi:DUF1707 domain-containing protein [Crossiella sp. SN42]|uniref:DUF1707 SHOCT-like domain-containing protein n=1 Tax=Crossiella sp. SN42 TaxID=2944808 RepID=UPI00207D302D|nr:DUF1707 domain-containing protein [Crossiella sp. SN42]MCO1577457.1 DUF1707 domain-containing protein [Crossiella sp. SN42]
MAGEDTRPVVRISDQEREAAVARLNTAVADGRLTWPEHNDRLAKAYAARTAAELAPVLADLGKPAPPAQRVVAVGSKIQRAMEPGRVEVKAVFGAVILDLSGLSGDIEVEVVANAFCGKVIITVPGDATVLDEGSAVLGKRALPGATATPGPRVRITGRSTLSKLAVLRG